ncbi:MAG TPA: hypothetical protein VKU40_02430, partial [Thermoanaerobaculia bacterium]|nr:hypothetical protein [Thermoanaerobaculia bacterium]
MRFEFRWGVVGLLVAVSCLVPSGAAAQGGPAAVLLPLCTSGGGPPPGHSAGVGTTRGRGFVRDVVTPRRQAVLVDDADGLRRGDDFTADSTGGFGDAEPVGCDTPLCESPELLESLEPKPDRTLTASWVADGLDGFPRDPQVAAGPTHLLVTTSGDGIAIYEKNGRLATEDRFGQKIEENPISAEDFFGWMSDLINPTLNLGLFRDVYERGELAYGIDEYYDLRAVFDTYRDRFWIVALARNSKAREGTLLEQQYRRSKLIVAVSTSEDPRDPWRFYWFDAVPGDGDCLDACGCEGTDYIPGAAADYPSLGVNQDAVLITNVAADNNKLGLDCLPFDNKRRHMVVTRLDAAAFADGSNGADDVVVYTRFDDVGGELASSTIQPALHHTATPLHGRQRPFYALSTFGGDRVVVWAFYAGPPRIERVAVRVEPYFSHLDDPDRWLVPQKVGRGLASSRRVNMGKNVGNSVLEAVYRDGWLHG